MTDALIRAIVDGDYESFDKTLPTPGIDLNAALEAAVSYGRDSMVEKLLKKEGIQVDARNASGSTALMSAAHRGFKCIASMLIDKGANVNAAHDDIGQTPLMLAAYRGNTHMVNFLIDKGADVNAVDTSNVSVLDLAALGVKLDTVRILAERGATTINPRYRLANNIVQDVLAKRKVGRQMASEVAVKKNLPAASNMGKLIGQFMGGLTRRRPIRRRTYRK